ncbi:MAG: hypothetical protein GY906_23955 [bacterium]|nr:hypothetical protein [bacterium]
MRFFAYGPLFLVAAATTADAATPLTLPSEILQGSALAVLGWTIWYVLSRTLPAHTKAMESQRKDFLIALERERKSGD